MKKTLIRLTLALLLTAAMLLPLTPGAYAAGNYMAYNFYSNPSLTGSSRKFDSFMIDFRGTITPTNTYWSLCNFSMYLGSSRTQAAYPGISGGGAYCGLQNNKDGYQGILSFWETKYQSNGEDVIMTSTRVYPDGSSTFTGEGDGTNCIADYPWVANQWYRMLLHSWTDAETDTTFVGIWFMDVSTGVWTLFSYFDTHLYDSYLTGAMSQFQENYWQYGDYNYQAVRECNLKNMYVHDIPQAAWRSLAKSTLSYGDGGGKNKAGAHTFGMGVDPDGSQYWWGSTGGEVEDQAAYEAAAVQSAVYTINQPSSPTLNAAQAASAEIVDTDAGREVRWTVPATAAPQLGYTVNVYDYDGALIKSVHRTRPEERSLDISDVGESAIRCEVVIDTVFESAAQPGEALSPEYIALLEAADPETDFCFILTAGEVSATDAAMTVSLEMRNPTDPVYGFSADVLYDPDRMTFDSAAFDEAFPWARAVDRGDRVRVFAATDVSSPVTGDCVLAQLSFVLTDANRAEGDAYAFSLDFYNGQPAYTVNKWNRPVDLTGVKKGTLTVTLTEGYDPYDLNGDRAVTISDVTALLDCLSGEPTAVRAGANADLNADGQVTISDVTALLDHLSGN